MSGTFRSDGMDSPISINGGGRMTWSQVWERADESEAVESYDDQARSIKWVGEKEPEVFGEPTQAWNAISAMESN